MGGNRISTVLLFRAAGRRCALPVERVVETMRPLPYEAIAGGPDFVPGVALVRGAPTPVLDLGGLLDGVRREVAAAGRWVTVRAGARSVALAVEEVLGVAQLAAAGEQGLPPLFQGSAGAGVRALGRLDGELLTILESARVVPEDTAP